MTTDTNAIPIEAWNTVLFDKFVRFRRVLTTGLAEHGEVTLRERPYPKGARVLDIGCGFGDATLAIADQTGPEGQAVGVDCSENFIALARNEAAAATASNASFLVADVQTDKLGGPYDHAFARFGTMFFNLPGAAMRNIGRALKRGGELAMVVWRKREDNPWLHDSELLVREIVPTVSHAETTEVHCGPGPFSMSGADMVSDMLQSAGFTAVSFQRHDCDICIGEDIDDAIAFAMALGPAGEIIRLAGEAGEGLRPAVADALGALFKRLRRSDGSIWAGSSSWTVRARRLD